jgi:hypothetical protein
MCIIIRTHINSFVPLHQIWIKTAAGRNYQRYPDVLFLFLEFPFFWGGIRYHSLGIIVKPKSEENWLMSKSFFFNFVRLVFLVQLIAPIWTTPNDTVEIKWMTSSLAPFCFFSF